MSDLRIITADEAHRLMQQGALLFDIRESDEHRRESIAGAQNAPLSALDQTWSARSKPVIFHCQSGMRTQANTAQLQRCADGEAYIMAGGIEAWRAAGLPVQRDERAPLPMQRQVMIAAGGLILLIALAAALLDVRVLWLAPLIGAGLFQAGITGWCGMAKLLGLAPWNRAAKAARLAA
ncbi:MAG: rhodanese family protein [Pseudomonadota bacterium]